MSAVPAAVAASIVILNKKKQVVRPTKHVVGGVSVCSSDDKSFDPVILAIRERIIARKKLKAL